MSAPESEQRDQRSSVKITMAANHEARPEVKVVEGTTEEEMTRIRKLAVEQLLLAVRETQ